jgi:2-oxo-4-hydroxy-4-carboxy-5-ureidoimidazoline decarboxylase
MINKINKLSKTEFIKVFANIFENSEWIANELYNQKPFINFMELSSSMIEIFENTKKENQLKILSSHPDLADKTKIGTLTADSKNEQDSAGLDKCTPEEFNEFKNLNYEYKKKFGFPFIFAVKDKSKLQILANFKKRISCDINVEFEEAKTQVKKIASLRLNEINKK